MANVPGLFFSVRMDLFFFYQLPSVHLLSMLPTWLSEQREWEKMKLKSLCNLTISMYKLFVVGF